MVKNYSNAAKVVIKVVSLGTASDRVNQKKTFFRTPKVTATVVQVTDPVILLVGVRPAGITCMGKGFSAALCTIWSLGSNLNIQKEQSLVHCPVVTQQLFCSQ